MVAKPTARRPVQASVAPAAPRGANASKPARRRHWAVWALLLLLLSAPLALLVPSGIGPREAPDPGSVPVATAAADAVQLPELKQRLEASGLAAYLGGSVEDSQRPQDLAGLLARAAGPELPQLPLPTPASQHPVREALATYAQVMQVRLPAPTQLDVAIERLGLGPNAQAALGQLILAYSQAVVLQREAMAGLSPEERRFVGLHPQTVGEWLGQQEAPTWDAYQMEAIRILAAKGNSGKTFQAADLLARAAEAAKGPLAQDRAPPLPLVEALLEGSGQRATGKADPFAVVHTFLGLLSAGAPPAPAEPLDLREALVSLHGSYGFPVPSEKALEAGLPPSFDHAVARIVAAKAYGAATGDAEGEATLFLHAASQAQPVLEAWAALLRLQKAAPEMTGAAPAAMEPPVSPPAPQGLALPSGGIPGIRDLVERDLEAFEAARDAVLPSLPAVERAALLQAPLVQAKFLLADWGVEDARLVEAWTNAHLSMAPEARTAFLEAAARVAAHPDRDRDGCPDALQGNLRACGAARLAQAESKGFPALPLQPGAPSKTASSHGAGGETNPSEPDDGFPPTVTGREEDILFDDATANGPVESSPLCQIDAADGATCIGPASLLRIGGIGANLYDHVSVIHIDLGGDDEYVTEVAGPANIGLRAPPSTPTGCQARHPTQSSFCASAALEWPYCYRPNTVETCIPPPPCPAATFERFCVPRAAARGSHSIDIGGNDRYVTPDIETTQGAFEARVRSSYVDVNANATLHSLYNHAASILVDVAGDDVYRAGARSQGYAQRGVGLLIDTQGNDFYGDGSEQATVRGPRSMGGLFDLAGDDSYRFERQGILGNTTGVAVLFDGGGTDRYDSAIVPVDTSFATRVSPQSALTTQGQALGASTGLALFIDAGIELDTYLSLGVEGETNDLSGIKNDQTQPNGAGAANGLFSDGAPVRPEDFEDPDDDGVPSLLEVRVFGTDPGRGDSNPGHLFHALKHLGEDPDDPLGLDPGQAWLDTPRPPVPLGGGQTLYLPGMVIGGRSDSHYPEWAPFIVDLGGNDTYTAPYVGGVVPFVEAQGVAPWVQRSDRPPTDVVLLLDVGTDAHGGDDTYAPQPCRITQEAPASSLWQPGDPAMRTGSPTRLTYAFPAACPSLGGAVNGVAVLGDDGGRNLFQAAFHMDITASTTADSETHFVAQLAGYGVMQGAGLFDGVGVLSTWNATNTFRAEVQVRASEVGSTARGSHRPSALARGVAQGAGLGGTGILAAFGLGNDTYLVEAQAHAVWPNGLDFGAAEGDSQGAGLSGIGLLLDEGGHNHFTAAQGFAQGSASGDNVPANTLLAGAPAQCLGGTSPPECPGPVCHYTTTQSNCHDRGDTTTQLPGTNAVSLTVGTGSLWMVSRPPVGLLWTGSGNDELVAGAFSQAAALGRRCPALWTSWTAQGNVGGAAALGALLDAGGNDRYRLLPQAPPPQLAQPFALQQNAPPQLVLSCGWPSADPAFALGQGAGALGGMALLLDAEGDDAYDARGGNLTQGAGMLGIGALVDLGGHDESLALGRSQGYAIHEFVVHEQIANQKMALVASAYSTDLNFDRVIAGDPTETMGLLVNQGGWDSYSLQGGGRGQGRAEIVVHPLAALAACPKSAGSGNSATVCTFQDETCASADWTVGSIRVEEAPCEPYVQEAPPSCTSLWINASNANRGRVDRCHTSFTCLNVTNAQFMQVPASARGACAPVDSSVAAEGNRDRFRVLPSEPLPTPPGQLRCVLQCPASVIGLLVDSGGFDTYDSSDPKCALEAGPPTPDCIGDDDGNDWVWHQGLAVNGTACTAHATGLANPDLAWMRSDPDGSCALPWVLGSGIDRADPLPAAESLLNPVLEQLGAPPLRTSDQVASVDLRVARDPGGQTQVGPSERVDGTLYLDAAVTLGPGLGAANIQRVDFLLDDRLMGQGAPWGDGTRFLFPWVTRAAGDTLETLRVPDGEHTLVASAFITPDPGASGAATGAASQSHAPAARPTLNVESQVWTIHLDNPPLLGVALSQPLIAPDLGQASQLTITLARDYAWHESGGEGIPGGRIRVTEQHVLATAPVAIHDQSHAAGTFTILLDGACGGGCPDGRYLYEVEAVDAAGRSTAAAVELIRDRRAPSSSLNLPAVIGRADLEGNSGVVVGWDHSDLTGGLGAGNSSGVAGVRLLRLNEDDSLMEDLRFFDASVQTATVRGVSTGSLLRLITVATDRLGHSESPCLTQPGETPPQPVEAPPCYRAKLAAEGPRQTLIDFSLPTLAGLQPNPVYIQPGETARFQVHGNDTGAGIDRVFLEFNTGFAAAEMQRENGTGYGHDATAHAAAGPPAETPLVVTVRAMDFGGNQRVLSGTGFLDSLPPRVKPLATLYGVGGEELAAARGSTLVVRAQVADVAVADVAIDVAGLRPNATSAETKTCSKDPELFRTWRCEVLVPADAPDGILQVPWRVTDAAGNVNTSAASDVEVRGFAPVITDVQVSNHRPDGFTVRWRTDAEATSQVHFGVTPAVPSATVPTLSHGREHEVELVGLAPATDYFIKAVSRNRAGIPGEGPLTSARTLSAYALGLPGLAEGTNLNGTVALPLEVKWIGSQDDAVPVEVAVRIQDAARLASPQSVGQGSFNAGSYAFPLDTRRIPDGEYRILLEGSRAGDSLQFVSPRVHIDNTAPVLVPLHPLPAGQVTVPRPTLALSLLDPLGNRPLPLESVRVTLDGRASSFQARFGQAWAPGTPQTLHVELGADLGEGTHTSRVQIRDAAGNLGTAQWDFTVDSRAPTALGPPTVQFLNATSAVRPGGTLRIGLNVTDPAGVASGRAERGPLGEPVPLLHGEGDHWWADVAIAADAPSGPLEIPLLFTDALGTEGEVGTVRVQVDATPPALRWATVETDGYTGLSLRVQASEPVLAVATSGLAQAAHPTPATNHTLRLEGLAPGRLHPVNLLLTDVAGNALEVSLEGATPSDPEAPSATQITVASPREGVVELQWEAAQDNVGLAGYRVERRDANGTWAGLAFVPAGNLSFVDQDAPAGRLVAYRVLAVDVGGLMGPPAQATVQVMALPHLTAADVTPRLGPADRPFTFRVLYRHAAGLPPGTAEVRIGELRIPLAPADANPDCQSGCLLTAKARLPATGIAPREPVTSFHATSEGWEARLELGWTPRVLAAADAGFQDASARPAALPALPLLVLALAAVLLLSRRLRNPPGDRA